MSAHKVDKIDDIPWPKMREVARELGRRIASLAVANANDEASDHILDEEIKRIAAQREAVSRAVADRRAEMNGHTRVIEAILLCASERRTEIEDQAAAHERRALANESGAKSSLNAAISALEEALHPGRAQEETRILGALTAEPQFAKDIGRAAGGLSSAITSDRLKHLVKIGLARRVDPSRSGEASRWALPTSTPAEGGSRGPYGEEHDEFRGASE